MLADFKKHIAAKQLFGPKEQLLLAISGGPDSVVLAHLLKESGFRFSLAHCNFQLRGSDSAADEAFCRQLAKKLGVPIYIQQVDAKGFAKQNGLSIQMAARQLRYDWFSQLLTEKKLDRLLTAHTAGDAVETLLINLLRGTGINGLKGIPEASGQMIRPLLPFSKAALLKYAATHKISYRTDKSNAETKYERNFLRLKVIPLLQELQPAFDQVMQNNLANFKEEADMVKDFLARRAKKLTDQKNGWTRLDKTALKKEKYLRSVLHTLLSPFHFNATQMGDIEANLRSNGLVGKILQSPTHTLTIDRQYLVIKPHGPAGVEEITIHSYSDLGQLSFLRLAPLKKFTRPAANELVLEKDRLIFPITLRGKSRGDKFKPFGMNGFKLLSDFLKDQKLNNFEKENCTLLVNGNGEIIWVLGHRSDERYKVTPGSKNLIKLSQIE